MNKLIDFSQKPAYIATYNFGDSITRENFINFLVLSYAVSRGNFVTQKVFFIMMEEKVGFPYEKVIENFYEHGSFDALLKEEQDIFLKAFYSVRKHMEKFEEIELEDEIRDEIGGLYDRPKNTGLIPLNTALGYFKFNQINSVSDFTKTASDFDKKFQDSLN